MTHAKIREPVPDEIFEELVDYFGGLQPLQKALGYRSRQSLYDHKSEGMPVNVCFAVEVLTKGAIRASRLNSVCSLREQQAAQLASLAIANKMAAAS